MPIYYLPGTIHKVGTQRKAYFSRGLGQGFAQYGYISLANLSFGELRLKVQVRSHAFGNHHQPARGHIQSMSDERPGGVRVALPYQAVDILSLAFSRYGEHAGRLVYHANVFIIVYCFQAVAPFLFQRVGRHIDALEHPVARVCTCHDMPDSMPSDDEPRHAGSFPTKT